jgi:hypothetical protein
MPCVRWTSRAKEPHRCSRPWPMAAGTRWCCCLPHGTGVAGTVAPNAPPDTEARGRCAGPAHGRRTGRPVAVLPPGPGHGPGTGRHEDQPAWYLPLRGRSGAYGAALLPLRAWAGQPPGAWPAIASAAPGLASAGDLAQDLAHAQALCDQAGVALERAAALRAAAANREAAQAQTLRNTLLAAISHDHRTPLATILSRLPCTTRVIGSRPRSASAWQPPSSTKRHNSRG